MTKKLPRLGFIALCVALAAPLAWAQAPAYPSKSVQLITGFPPGTGTDIAARVVADKLSSMTGQQFVVVNKPGAAGSLAAGVVAASPADGYTLLFTSSAHTLYPMMYPGLKFDPAKDFVGVSSVAEVELVLVTSPTKGWNSLADMMNAGKAKPDTLTYGSAGVGTSTQLSFARLAASAHVTALHVPFKGASEALTEVIAGRVDGVFTAITGTVTGGIQTKQLMPLAISNRKRSTALPDVPTTLEAGYADSDSTAWVGLLASSAVPKAIVEQLNKAVVAALNDPETSERLMKSGLVPMPQSAAQFDAQIHKEFVSNAKLMKAVGGGAPSP